MTNHTLDMKNLPIGAIIFLHGTEMSERVPYQTEEELTDAYRNAVSSMNINCVWPYVRADRADIAERLMGITREILGEAYSVYQLTPENIRRVLR